MRSIHSHAVFASCKAQLLPRLILAAAVVTGCLLAVHCTDPKGVVKPHIQPPKHPPKPVVDSGVVDAGFVDAGRTEVPDAGRVDDAGIVVDAGVVVVVDAGVVDAGVVVVDAGVFDAGVVVVVDAGAVDAGVAVVDAGPLDAGVFVIDAGIEDSGTVVVDAALPPCVDGDWWSTQGELYPPPSNTWCHEELCSDEEWFELYGEASKPNDYWCHYDDPFNPWGGN